MLSTWSVGECAWRGEGVALSFPAGPQDLHVLVRERRSEHFGEGEREGESLLAGGAARAPGADLLARTLLGEHLRNDPLRKLVPGVLVAEERGDLDEHRGEQRIVFGGMA